VHEVHESPLRAYPLKQLRQLVEVPRQVLQVESHLIIMPSENEYPDFTVIQAKILLSPSLHD
jgi:hypothetical protein